MAESYPPPPPPGFYAPPKVRPDIVTKYAVVTLVLGIICIIFSIWGFYTGGYLIGAILLVAGAFALICGLGMLTGRKWALKLSGHTLMDWTKREDVIAFFGLFPAYSTAPPQHSSKDQPISPPIPPPPDMPHPSTTVCPTCGQNITFIGQYQRWYCQNCKKYI